LALSGFTYRTLGMADGFNDNCVTSSDVFLAKGKQKPEKLHQHVYQSCHISVLPCTYGLN